MSMYLNHRATIQCTHGGRVVLIPPFSRSFHPMQSPVVTEPDLYMAMIVGCAQISPFTKPCTKIVQVVLGKAIQIQVDNQTPILESLLGITDGVPPGTVMAINNGGSNACPGFVSPQAATLGRAAENGTPFCDT